MNNWNEAANLHRMKGSLTQVSRDGQKGLRQKQKQQDTNIEHKKQWSHIVEGWLCKIKIINEEEYTSFRIKNEWLYTLRTFSISLLFISIFIYEIQKYEVYNITMVKWQLQVSFQTALLKSQGRGTTLPPHTPWFQQLTDF